MNKKKLLLLLTLPPPVHGSNYMNQAVVDNKILHNRFNIKLLSLNYVNNISEIGSFKINKILKFMVYLFKLFQLLIFFRPDAVYFVPSIFGLSFFRDCFYVAIVKIFRVKLILHLHAKGLSKNDCNFFFVFLYKFFFKNTYVILLSKILYSDIERYVDKQNIFIVPNGVDINNKYLKLCFHNPLRFVFLSNLIATKGIYVLLESCSILKKSFLKFELLCVGNTSKSVTKNDLEKYIDYYNLRSAVCYVGPRYSIDKYNILNTCDILVFPTYKDCFPLVILEAMSLGLPVISTYEGAIPEIIDNGITGYLVQRNDPVDLAQAMAKFINNPELVSRFGKSAQDKFLTKYTIDSFNQKFSTVISNLIYN